MWIHFKKSLLLILLTGLPRLQAQDLHSVLPFRAVTWEFSAFSKQIPFQVFWSEVQLMDSLKYPSPGSAHHQFKDLTSALSIPKRAFILYDRDGKPWATFVFFECYQSWTIVYDMARKETMLPSQARTILNYLIAQNLIAQLARLVPYSRVSVARPGHSSAVSSNEVEQWLKLDLVTYYSERIAPTIDLLALSEAPLNERPSFPVTKLIRNDRRLWCEQELLPPY